MHSEPGASILANMSAPPRSTVMLPRLAAGIPIDGKAAGGSTRRQSPVQDVPVGPGGGRLLSQALCLARVELPTAVCAHLRMGYGAPLLTRPLGLARALVAIARQAAGNPGAARGLSRRTRLELDRVGEVPEGELVRELTSRLASVEWPHWVPRAGMVTLVGVDIAAGAVRERPPKAPEGVTCPLLAARMVSAMRGPVFMRDTAPTLTHLLDLFGGTTLAGAWELWLPVRPGAVRPPAPAPSMAHHATNLEQP
jgi:hypothetical protein